MRAAESENGLSGKAMSQSCTVSEINNSANNTDNIWCFSRRSCRDKGRLRAHRLHCCRHTSRPVGTDSRAVPHRLHHTAQRHQQPSPRGQARLGLQLWIALANEINSLNYHKKADETHIKPRPSCILDWFTPKSTVVGLQQFLHIDSSKIFSKTFFLKFPFHNNRTCFQTFIFYLRTSSVLHPRAA